MIERTCKQCGVIYKTFPSIRLLFCGKKCFDASKRNGEFSTCQQCGKSIYSTPGGNSRPRKRFCSRSCATTARNLSSANPSYKRDITGDKNPMFGVKKTGEQNPMFGMTGEKCPRWKGGIKSRKDGYIMEYQKDHPSRNGRPGYVLQHRLVMERHLGRFLSDDEVVHHVNENPSDNRIDNLQVMTQSEHAALHFGR